MPADRRAQVLAVLEFLLHLGEGNIVVDRWRAELVAELEQLDAGKEQAA
jgi:hypothetical protein